MQDNHLFRGKRPDDREWIYGQPHNFGSKVLIVGDIEDFESEWIAMTYWWEVDPATVSQCTGMKDKNWNLIFEGDILKDVDSSHCEVAWDEVGFICDGGNVSFEHWKDCEIIGNIYEHSELLGQ